MLSFFLLFPLFLVASGSGRTGPRAPWRIPGKQHYINTQYSYLLVYFFQASENNHIINLMIMLLLPMIADLFESLNPLKPSVHALMFSCVML
jgi:hypothetical protein